MKTLSSQITSVTVFSSIAAVTRVAAVSLPKGESLVAFERLPETMTEKSVQVKGFGKAILGNVKIEKVFYDNESDARKNELMDKALKSEEELRVANDKILRLNKEKGFIDEIVKKVTSPNEKTKESELDPEKWMKMISFYKEKMEVLDKSILSAEKEKIKSQEEYDQLKSLLAAIGNPQAKKQKFRVSVLLELPEAGEVTLELSYHVPGAHWYPLYDVRVSSDKKINLSYQAMVSQSSGENWENTELKISTAKPKIQGNLPELHPWYLEFESHGVEYETPAATRVSSKAAFGGSGAAASAPLLKMEEMTKRIVKVETGATAVTFVIAGKHTVKSDGSEEKVSILMGDFTAQFQYASVPCLLPYTYLTAKVKNETEFPLLAGDANVFLDGNFVAVSKLKQVAPTEEFSLSLGIDEGFKIERKVIKEFEKEGGSLFSKKTVVKSYEYLITVKNFKKTEEEITIWDQLPISQHETLKVQLIEPVYKEDTEELKKDKFEKLQWVKKIGSGKEFAIPLKYSIEVPVEYKDRIIGINF